ncbi:unnamed protein product [Orchesella dallaii]|uniref:Gustatory receptor n=1 Tax=Orchesella dallaii TaxID=48710 RepID=A0ABP1RRY4_9HEXA
MSKVVFENLFLFSFTIGFIHNVIYWRTRKSFPVLYKRCTTFCNLAHVTYLPHTNRRYPLEDDGLGGMMRMASCINIVFTICVFLLSMGTPTAHPFFANLLPQDIFEGKWKLLIRILFSLFEAYITAFAWTSNTSIILLLPNFALLLKFWCSELQSNSPPNQISKSFSKLRELEETIKTYRQLQLLTTQVNECFAAQVGNLFMLAFINQVSVNYGTLRLYSELSIQAWVACPYLTVDGAFNILSVHNLLAMPYESSKKSVHSWRNPKMFKDRRDGKDMIENTAERRRITCVKYLKVVGLSCCPLKAKYGSLKFVKKDQGIEWVDSLIDSTVTVLLWK